MLFKGNPEQGLFGASVGFFVGMSAVALFGSTAGKFQELMDLTPIMVGFLAAAPALTGSLLRIPFAAWADAVGGRKPFIVLLGLSLIGMIGLNALMFLRYPKGITISVYPLLALFGLLAGCGIATFSVGVSQVSYWFPQSRQGGALGMFAGIGNLAPGIFSLLMPIALSAWGIRVSYLAWTVFLFIGFVFYLFAGRDAWYFQSRKLGANLDKARSIAEEQGQEIFPVKSTKESLTISSRLWKTWALAEIYFTAFGGFIAMTAWLPFFWKSFFSVGALPSGLLTAIFSLIAAGIRIPGGALADRLGGERTLFFALIIALLGSTLMTFSHSLPVSVIAVLLMAIGMGVSNAAVFKIIPKEAPQVVGGVAGWVGGLGACGGFILPPLFGSFVHRYGQNGYATGFVVYIALMVVAILLTQILKAANAKPAMR